MDYLFLICSFSLFGAAFAFYKLHKLWHRDVTENEELYDFQIKFKSVRNWLGIIMLIMGGVVYFFRALP